MEQCFRRNKAFVRIRDLLKAYSSHKWTCNNNQHPSKIQKIMENVHEFRISRYKDNSENIKLAEEYFGKLRNKYDMPILNVVDRGEHLIPPEEPVADSLPTECTCKAYAMHGDKMWACGPIQSIIIKNSQFPNSHHLWGQHSTVIDKKLFFDDINDDLTHHFACSYCISNAKVAKTLKKAEA